MARAAKPGILRHASLHGVSGAKRRYQTPPEAPRRLRATMLAMVADGWTLHRLVTVHSLDQLDHELAAAEELASQGRVLIRATAAGVGGHAATVIIDEQVALVGLDDPHTSVVEQTLVFDDAAATRFWIEHFGQVWHDRRHTHVLVGAHGLDHFGAGALRRRLRDLQRHVTLERPQVELTPALRDVLAAFSDHPPGHARPTVPQVAEVLNIASSSVKSRVDRLCELLDVPPGNGRIDRLIDTARSSGHI